MEKKVDADKPSSTNSSLKDHLSAAMKFLGKAGQNKETEKLLSVCPPASVHVWRWFHELNSQRRSGFGMEALDATLILAWAKLRGIKIAPWEASLLFKLDLLYRSKKASGRGNQDGSSGNPAGDRHKPT